MYSGVHEKALCVVGGVVLQHVSLLVFPPRRAAAGGARCPPAPAPAPPPYPPAGLGDPHGEGVPCGGGGQDRALGLTSRAQSQLGLGPAADTELVLRGAAREGGWVLGGGEGEAEDVMGRPDLGN